MAKPEVIWSHSRKSDGVSIISYLDTGVAHKLTLTNLCR